MEYPGISKNRLHELAALKQKKRRLEAGLVVVEGERVLRQLKAYDVRPQEQYLGRQESAFWPGLPAFTLQAWQFGRICESESPPRHAALFALPSPAQPDFKLAFYLDGIADPGNLGALFRVAAAFGLDAVFLSPNCAEYSSPKVIRASLGSVYRVPFAILTARQLAALGARILLTDSHSGSALDDFQSNDTKRTVIVLGSEAQGLSPELRAMGQDTLRIGMLPAMESLNVAVAAGIIAHHFWGGTLSIDKKGISSMMEISRLPDKEPR